MRKIFFIAGFLTVILAGCNADGRKAEALYQRAETSFLAENFSLAKLQIDSIRALYPKVFDVRKAGIKLMQQVELKEQEKTLVYLDSALAAQQLLLDSIKGNFVLEKDTMYQETGNYFYPSQVVERNIGRSFLRAQVSETGEMSITSIYSSPNPIHHWAVRVSSGDLFAETPRTADGYETTNLGVVMEKADYKLGNDGGVIAFIVSNRDKKSLKLEFIGDRKFVTYLYANDIKAIAAVNDLAKVLSAMEEIRKEQKEARLKIQFVTRKMQEGENKENE